MNGNTNENNPLQPQATNIAFIQARWHADIVDECRKSFITSLSELSQGTSHIDVYDVPGAYEAPLLAKKLAISKRYDAIVVSALVVDGGIYRHDFVANAVVSGLMDVQLQTDVPVLSAVLTPHNFHSNEEHYSFYREHFVKKGLEAAEACHSVIANFQTLANVA